MPWQWPYRRAASAPAPAESEAVAAAAASVAARHYASGERADSTLAEVLAAARANAAGFNGLIWLTGNGEPTAFAPVLRGLDLLSGVWAQLITQPGSLHIRRHRDGRHMTGYPWDGIVRWLSEAPDGGQTPPFPWWQDYGTDFGLGNALCTEVEPRVLVRLRASTAGSIVAPDGSLVYSAQPFDEAISMGEKTIYPRRKVIHARWAQTSNALQDSRRLFADAPLQVVREASEAGQRMDAYIRFRYRRGGWKDGVLMSLDDDGYGHDSGSGQSAQFLEMGKAWSGGQPENPSAFVWGTKVAGARLEPTMVDMQTVEMRNQQVRTAGMVFGVPSPYLNEEVSAWGSGIEQLSRIFWRTSAQPKLLSLLSPFSARLLPRGYSFGVDETEYLRGDWEATAKLLAVIHQAASQSQQEPDLDREERRHLLGAPPDGKTDDPVGGRPAGVAPPPERMR